MFAFRQPKGGITPVRKVSKSTKNEELLRLRSYLDAAEPRTIEILVGFWEGQRNAISYAEISNMLAGHNADSVLLEQWREEYAVLVNTRLAPEMTKMMQLAADKMRERFPQLLYDPAMTAAHEYTARRGAELITMITNTQRDAIKAIVTQAVGYDVITADALSRIIRPLIGLTVPQSLANLRCRHAAWLAGIEAGLTGKAAEARAGKLSAAYAARQHRYRAMSIARTELAMAYNEGAYGATIAAQQQGYLGDMVKVWLTAADERVCEICAPLDGVRVNISGLFPSNLNIPPAHPQCRCAVAFEEITESLQPNRNTGIIEPERGIIQEEARGADVTQEKIREHIRSDEVIKTINPEKQGRHDRDSEYYTEGRSYLLPGVDAQELVDRYHGTGHIPLSKTGKWQKEVIEADRDIGYVVDRDTGIESPTNRFTIHYSKTGTHISPVRR